MSLCEAAVRLAREGAAPCASASSSDNLLSGGGAGKPAALPNKAEAILLSSPYRSAKLETLPASSTTAVK